MFFSYTLLVASELCTGQNKHTHTLFTHPKCVQCFGFLSPPVCRWCPIWPWPSLRSANCSMSVHRTGATRTRSYGMLLDVDNYLHYDTPKAERGRGEFHDRISLWCTFGYGVDMLSGSSVLRTISLILLTFDREWRLSLMRNGCLALSKLLHFVIIWF